MLVEYLSRGSAVACIPSPPFGLLAGAPLRRLRGRRAGDGAEPRRIADGARRDGGSPRGRSRCASSTRSMPAVAPARSRRSRIARAAMRERGSSVELVADEWANTVEDIHEFNRAGAADMVQIKTPDLGGLHHSVEAVLDCRAHGVLAHIGGSCWRATAPRERASTSRSPGGADQMLDQPGMGVDEGLAIVANEMARTLRLEAGRDRDRRQAGLRRARGARRPAPHGAGGRRHAAGLLHPRRARSTGSAWTSRCTRRWSRGCRAWSRAPGRRASTSSTC